MFLTYIFNFNIYREFKRNLLLVGDNHVKVKTRMIAIVVFVPLVFLLRMALVLVDLGINLSAYPWFDWFYYTLFEFIPVLTLVILSSNSTNPNQLQRGTLLTSYT